MEWWKVGEERRGGWGEGGEERMDAMLYKLSCLYWGNVV